MADVARANTAEGTRDEQQPESVQDCYQYFILPFFILFKVDFMVWQIKRKEKVAPRTVRQRSWQTNGLDKPPSE